jgi:monoterpene epsilon-lactone hydrolase
MRMVGVFTRLRYKPQGATREKATARLSAPKGSSSPPETMTVRHRISTRTIEGFTTYTVRPTDHPSGGAALYVHGGAYSAEITKQHWSLIDRFAREEGVRVEVPIYGLVPAHTAIEAFAFLTEVYRQLLTDHRPESITIIGDSAGGGLALAFTQTLAGLGLPQPARIVLISPWLDIALLNPEIADIDDPWLTRAGLLVAGEAWAGGLEPSDPRLSPINGVLQGLAPIDVYIGTRDIFYPDARQLRSLALDAGVTVEFHEAKGAVHVYPLTPTPEGRRASGEIVRSVRPAPR